ncbi:ParB/RepB/Spo0J family partition protein [Chloroflexota bacterium]
MSKDSTIASTVQMIDTALIVAGGNDRQHFDANALQDLAASIDAHGLAQPPTLRPLPCGRFEIVAGERRTRAMRDVLGWTTIPALVRELSDEEAAAIMLAENTGRTDLNPIEEANAYCLRMTRFGWNTRQVADSAGVSLQRVHDRLTLLDLVEDIQHFIKTGAFPVSYAKPLIDLDSNRQRIALRLFNTSSSMPMHRWRDVVRKLRDDQIKESQMGLFDLEALLSAQLAEHEDRPVKGMRARTGAPAGRDLPPVHYSKADSMAPIFDRYIRLLQDEGEDSGVAAVANIYNLFVARGWVTVTDNVVLPKISDAEGVREELHAAEF